MDGLGRYLDVRGLFLLLQLWAALLRHAADTHGLGLRFFLLMRKIMALV